MPRERHKAKRLLLYVHGGPGGAEMLFNELAFAPEAQFRTLKYQPYPASFVYGPILREP